jgi:replication factor A1
VTVTDPPADAAGTDAGEASGSGSGGGGSGGSGGSPGLDAFGDDGGSAETVTADADPADGETVQFTGTVVQAGDPVVLDDGTETRSVETDAELRLGEEVTVRGPIHDGRIDADEVY